MVKVNIYINGCDDSTYILDYKVTDLEFTFLKKLEKLSLQNSHYTCQPRLEIEVIHEKN